MGPIVRRAPLGVAEYFPRRIQLQDPVLIATGIGVMPFDEGAVGGLNAAPACIKKAPRRSGRLEVFGV